ncbi:MAG: SRPBCC domain-containing protein, partial [Actinomycetota bacterium]
KRTFKLAVTEMSAPSRMVWSDGMPLGLFKGERTYRVEPNGSGSTFTMVEEYTGLMAPLITKSIPDMTESFAQFADGLKEGAEGG